MANIDSMMSCCGIGEIHGIVDFDTHEFLSEFIEHNEVAEHKTFVFTDGKPSKRQTKGQKLAAAIRRNKLGKLYGPHQGPGQHGYPVQLWFWTPSLRGLKAYAKKHKIEKEYVNVDGLWSGFR